MPAADAQLEAKIVPDESAIEEVENRELELGGGGELSSSQENKRRGIISGGFRTALKALGIVSLLSALKPVTASLSSILAVLGRAILPTLEVLAGLFRPFNEFVNDFISEPSKTVEEDLNDIGGRLEEPNPVERRPDLFRQGGPIPVAKGSVGESIFQALGLLDQQNQSQNRSSNNSQSEAIKALSEALAEVSTGQGSGSPDQSDEANKIDQTESFRATLQDKTGASQ